MESITNVQRHPNYFVAMDDVSDWTERHRPERMSTLVGNDAQRTRVTNWLKLVKWNPLKTRGFTCWSAWNW